VRAALVQGPEGRLNRLPLNLIGVVRRIEGEEAERLRALDPLLFMASDPETGAFMWFSFQVCVFSFSVSFFHLAA
jgi:hypothetical protein